MVFLWFIVGFIFYDWDMFYKVFQEINDLDLINKMVQGLKRIFLDLLYLIFLL